MKANIKIKEATLAQAFKVHKLIPEFIGNPYPPNSLSDFKKEVKGVNYLCTVAYDRDNPAAYCVSYDKYKDGSFYLWMTGVLPEYRKAGVFSLLARYLEKWAKDKGYEAIVVRTWNKRIGMRIALTKLGYNIVGFEEKPSVDENRLIYEKVL